MSEQNTFKGTPIMVGDDDFVPDENFNGFTVSEQDMEKMRGAGMIRTKEVSNVVNKASKKKLKARKRRKLAKQSKRKNRR